MHSRLPMLDITTDGRINTDFPTGHKSRPFSIAAIEKCNFSGQLASRVMTLSEHVVEAALHHWVQERANDRLCFNTASCNPNG